MRTGDDDRVAGPGDRVELGGAVTLKPAEEKSIVQLEHERREQHRDRDDHHEELGRAGFEYAERACRSEEDKGKFSAL
jgi:hypothetical protein